MLFFRFLAVSFATLLLVGCGIDEEVYNAKVMEANKLKEDLAAATASNNKMTEDIALLRTENKTLANRLAELGENVQKLLGEKGVLATDLAATKEREARLRRESPVHG